MTKVRQKLIIVGRMVLWVMVLLVAITLTSPIGVIAAENTVDEHILSSEVLAPVSPDLLTPEYGTFITDWSPTFSWKFQNGVVAYTLLVTREDGWKYSKKYSAAGNCPNGLCSVTPNFALVGWYWWTVTAENAQGQKTTSARSGFSVIPVMTSPAAGSIVGAHPTFRWGYHPGAVLYRLFVEGPGLRYEKWYSASACSGGTCSATPNFNLVDGRYRWTLSIKDSRGYVVDPLAPREFRVESGEPPDPGSGDGGTDNVPPLEIVSVVPTQGFVYFNEPYYVDISLRNPADSRQYGTLLVMESGLRLEDGDIVGITDGELDVSIPAHSTASYRIGPISHRFDWTEELSCFEISDLAMEAVADLSDEQLKEIIGSEVKFFGFVTTAIDVWQAGDQMSLRNTYDYGVTLLGTENETLDSSSAKVVVSVSPDQVVTYSIGLAQKLLAPGATLQAIAVLFETGDANVAAQLAEVEWALFEAGCSSMQQANSAATLPLDLNGALMLRPSKQHLGDLSNIAEAPSYNPDVYSDFREDMSAFEAAQRAGDTISAQQHLTEAYRDVTLILYELYRIRDDAETLDTGALSPEELALAIDHLQQNGLPEHEVNLFLQQGHSPADIESAAVSTIQLAPLSNRIIGLSEDPFSLPIGLYERLRTELGLRLITYSNNSGQTPPDLTSPTVTVELFGTEGLAGYFVSDVELVIHGTDNEGGTGLKNVQYSRDGGKTWLVVDMPLVIGDEGESHLLFRAEDLVGNISFPPTELVLLIDKTPPQVAITLDQYEFTRTMPGLLVQYETDDPEPGSGLASTAATFLGQPVMQGDLVSLRWLDLGVYTLSVCAWDVAGWQSCSEAQIELVATLASLQESTRWLCNNNYVTKKGLCNSLLSKLGNAQRLVESGQEEAAVGILSAFRNEVNAQAKGAITAEAVRVLLMDTSYVLQNILDGYQ